MNKDDVDKSLDDKEDDDLNNHEQLNEDELALSTAIDQPSAPPYVNEVTSSSLEIN